MISTEYRTARQAQDARYENETGLPVGDTDRQEYRDYFGVGDHAGRPVERRVTPQRWLVDTAEEREPDSLITERQAFFLTGTDLAALAEAGDWVAAGEIVRRAIQRAKKGKVA